MLVTRSAELVFLKLLAGNASPGEFEEPLLRARRDGADPLTLDAMARSKDLALQVDERFRQLTNRRNDQAALLDTVRDLGEQRAMDALLTTVARRARLLLSADMTAVCLRGDASGAMVRAMDGAVSQRTRTVRLPTGTGLAGEAARRRAAVWTADYFQDEQCPRDEAVDEFVREEGLSGVLVVPLCGSNEVLGVICCGQRHARSFGVEEVALMTAMAEYAACAIEQSRSLGDALARVAHLSAQLDRTRTASQAEARAADAGSEMIDLVLAGADLQSLATKTARLLRGSVTIRDEQDAVLAHSGPPLEESDELEKGVLEARAQNRAVAVDDDMIVVPLRAGRQDLGSLIARHRSPDACRTVLFHAARAIAVQLLVRRCATPTDVQVRDERLDMLLDSGCCDPKRAPVWADRLGMDISTSHALLVARAEPEQWRRIAARAASYVSRHGGAKTMRDGHLVLLLASETPGGTARDVARELGQALGEPITVGAASVSLTPDTARRAYRRALQALDTLASLGQWGSGATIEELGFVGMLLGETRDVAGFVEQTVGPVLEYDRDRSAELELTLEAYFAAGGSPTYAAEKLQVHPNTVSRRLERVSQLLGPDWQEPAHALEIQLALRLRRVRDSLDGTDG